jgi:hypothetical protein
MSLSLISIQTDVNSVIGVTRDKIDLEIKQIEFWLNDIISRNKSIKKNRCEICNSCEQSNNLELHHIAGRKHDPRTITVCKKCHRWLSDKQKTWDKRWLVTNASELLCTSFFHQGLQDILSLKSIKNGNSIYQKIADRLTEKISTYSESDWRQNYAVL